MICEHKKEVSVMHAEEGLSTNDLTQLPWTYHIWLDIS
jgi:hypothetical protein